LVFTRVLSTVFTKTVSERYDCCNHISSEGCGVNLSSKIGFEPVTTVDL